MMSPQNKNLQSLLFFDIITVREVSSFNKLPLEVQKSLAGKFNNQYIAQELDYSQKEKFSTQEVYDQQGMFHPEVSKVLAITTGMFVASEGDDKLNIKTHVISSPQLGDEATVINNFYSLVERMKAKRSDDGLPDLSLASFNGKRFDIPFLSKRSCINDITIPSWFETQGKKPWEHTTLDIMECWEYGGRNDYASLPSMAYAYGIKDIIFTPYYIADNLYHYTHPMPSIDQLSAGSYSEMVATMQLTKKLLK